MISRRFTIAAVAMGAAFFLTPAASFAAGSHLASAISETQAAISAGQVGHESSLVEHADNAIDHAMQVPQTAADSSFVKAGIKHLRKAIKIAYGTHMRSRDLAAARHAKAALKSFQAAQQN
jgi:hypothetical protein